MRCTGSGRIGDKLGPLAELSRLACVCGQVTHALATTIWRMGAGQRGLIPTIHSPYYRLRLDPSH
jgi:hypothetical protein